MVAGLRYTTMCAPKRERGLGVDGSFKAGRKEEESNPCANAPPAFETGVAPLPRHLPEPPPERADLVGVAGFEPATSRFQNGHASRLRYTPMCAPKRERGLGVDGSIPAAPASPRHSIDAGRDNAARHVPGGPDQRVCQTSTHPSISSFSS